MCVVFCKQKTEDERRISDWSSDVCSSDLAALRRHRGRLGDDKAGAAAREPGEGGVVPVVDDTVDGGILAHRRDGDAVSERDVLEREGIEKRRHAEGLSVGRRAGVL